MILEVPSFSCGAHKLGDWVIFFNAAYSAPRVTGAFHTRPFLPAA